MTNLSANQGAIMALRLRWPTEFSLLPQRFLERPGYYGQFKYIGVDGKSYSLPGHEGLDIQAPGVIRRVARQA